MFCCYNTVDTAVTINQWLTRVADGTGNWTEVQKLYDMDDNIILSSHRLDLTPARLLICGLHTVNFAESVTTSGTAVFCFFFPFPFNS